MPNREKVKKIQDDVPFRNTTLEGALRQGIYGGLEEYPEKKTEVSREEDQYEIQF